ncbi:MAG: uracil phosphoribosyltransferase [Nitrososphaerota archaeon]|nr:uracil phosphoribosyltransferase [Nitrososphaerota archaeon]
MKYGSVVRIVDNNYIKYLLTVLRNKDTPPVTFRRTMKMIGVLIGYEIAGDLNYKKISVVTPLKAKANGVSITQLNDIILVNILRAATPLIEGLQEIFFEAKLGIILLQRKEVDTIEKMDSILYFSKLPKITPNDLIIIADPALATGSTLMKAIKTIKDAAPESRIIIASVISTDYGINRIRNFTADKVRIYTVEIDTKLNKRGYIIPGLGDAGDRAFG